MHGRLRLLVVAMVLAACVRQAGAQTGPYIQMDLGMTVAPSLGVRGSDNDWGTKCDLIINPLGVEAGGECDSAPAPTSWTNEFGGGRGVGSGFALGHDWGGVRLEGEYFRRVTAYDRRADTDIFDDVTLDKQEQEIEAAFGRVDDLQGHGVFANAYFDFTPAGSPWTSYVGGGVGLERATLDYGSVWKRNDDPDRIATFTDPLLRAKLAGTTTIGDARLTDVVAGYQLLVGVDRRLGDRVALGVKFRWADFGGFVSDATPWDQLRSHESSVGRGEDVLYHVTTDDSRFWGVSLGLKYRF